MAQSLTGSQTSVSPILLESLQEIRRVTIYSVKFGVVVHTFNPITQEAEAAKSSGLRPEWARGDSVPK